MSVPNKVDLIDVTIVREVRMTPKCNMGDEGDFIETKKPLGEPLMDGTDK